MSFAVHYDCQRCTRCCRWPGQVKVSEEEIGRIARHVGMSEGDFIAGHTRLRSDRSGLALLDKGNGECAWLEGRDCRLQEVKPVQCLGFPNQWNFPGWRDECEAVPRLVRTSVAARAGFTLLELVAVMGIAILILSIAVPSVAGYLAEQELRENMESFTRMVREAQRSAMAAKAPSRLVFGKEGVLVMAEPPAGGAVMGDAGGVGGGGGGVTLSKEEALEFNRFGAMQKAPVSEWMLWPNGIIEPAEVRYTGPKGTWSLRYNPFKIEPEILEVKRR